MRSLLFVPGDSERKLAKATASGADALILDLEDSVEGAAKPRARALAREFLGSADRRGRQLFVRVNPLGTGEILRDLETVLDAAPDGVVLPKACGDRDIRRLDRLLKSGEALHGLPDGSISILPIVTETPAAVFAAAGIRSDPRLAALSWGAEDLSAALGASEVRDEEGRFAETFRFARSIALLAAAAANAQPVDTVWTDIADEAGLGRECDRARRDGFRGKLAIHPAQVPVINAGFAPSSAEIEHARKIVAAFASSSGAGVISLGGRMYDRPHLQQAETLLKRTCAAVVAPLV